MDGLAWLDVVPLGRTAVGGPVVLGVSDGALGPVEGVERVGPGESEGRPEEVLAALALDGGADPLVDRGGDVGRAVPVPAVRSDVGVG